MTDANQQTNPTVFQNPLYLHPSDGPSSLTVQEKLSGSHNYRAWRRAIEIGLSTKRKLGFIKGTVARSTNDPNLAELWDTCNNMVICWILGSVSESIARSIMFVDTASEIWLQLEKRFALSDGSRKYKLNKDTYAITQSGGSINEYYTRMNVESACSMLQQEESQRLLFGSHTFESTALYSKGVVKDKCSICGYKWHPPEKCWEKVGYPAWHPKAKLNQGKVQFKPRDGVNKNQWAPKTATHVESGSISFTPQQFEQLLRSVHQMKVDGDFDEGFGHHFAAGIACLNTQLDLLELLEGWIYDTGASDHMTPEDDHISDPYLLKIKPQIKLPNGETSVISHVGKVKLNNGLMLKDVLVDLSHDIPHVHHSAPTNSVSNSEPTIQSSSSVPNITAASNSNPTLRRSNRTTTLPTKMKDYVLPHLPKANQSSFIHLCGTKSRNQNSSPSSSFCLLPCMHISTLAYTHTHTSHSTHKATMSLFDFTLFAITANDSTQTPILYIHFIPLTLSTTYTIVMYSLFINPCGQSHKTKTLLFPQTLHLHSLTAPAYTQTLYSPNIPPNTIGMLTQLHILSTYSNKLTHHILLKTLTEATIIHGMPGHMKNKPKTLVRG
ncbi:hypothetical protein CTI12_AA402710 [Artemisia annua]|uniref:Retrotransposon Copia-like N-terminal domain-containing protein n=1 Tax=Artemisia annua TaxID=35608 RepID=A0A2U1MA92_ARTAN|nr:hypothetical protein CTI12_AA402710 [Artemisia annua]